MIKEPVINIVMRYLCAQDFHVAMISSQPNMVLCEFYKKCQSIVENNTYIQILVDIVM